MYGIAAPRRSPIESFFGYVVARNRVPVGYGGGWVFCNRLEIGANVFEAYRGGDSAYIFSQLLRVYWRYFVIDHAFIDSVQFGWDNVEGIHSGAFWFYYRLGFRPVDEELGAVAAIEWERIRAGRGYRTPTRTLRRLTGSSLVYRGGGEVAATPSMARLGLAVTRAVARDFNGDREAMDQWARSRIRHALPVGDTRSWPTDERLAFGRLSPLVALIPDLGRWPQRDKRSLVGRMRAKGGPRERDYVRKLGRHLRFQHALAELARAAGIFAAEASDL